MNKNDKPLFRTAVLLALAALLLALAWWWAPGAGWLAEHWRVQLREADEAQAKRYLQGVAKLAEPGIPVLVEALASSRPAVVQAAAGHLEPIRLLNT